MVAAKTRSKAVSVARSPKDGVATALAWFERHASKAYRADMAARYGIVTKDRTFGVSMAHIHKLAKTLGRDHELAAALWQTKIYEARLLAAFVAEPACVTEQQMDAWARSFDNWAVVDTLCFKLFDQTPHAWSRARAWCARREEFVKRAGFALIASLALHTKGGSKAPFLAALKLVEREAGDERNFVKKGVNWALRAIGRRQDTETREAARAVAKRLTASSDKTAAWVGRDALKAFAKR